MAPEEGEELRYGATKLRIENTRNSFGFWRWVKIRFEIQIKILIVQFQFHLFYYNIPESYKN